MVRAAQPMPTVRPAVHVGTGAFVRSGVSDQLKPIHEAVNTLAPPSSGEPNASCSMMEVSRSAVRPAVVKEDLGASLRPTDAEALAVPVAPETFSRIDARVCPTPLCNREPARPIARLLADLDRVGSLRRMRPGERFNGCQRGDHQQDPHDDGNPNRSALRVHRTLLSRPGGPIS